MVVATSDSNTTLVSLGNNDPRNKEPLHQSPISVVVTVPPSFEANVASLDYIETNIEVPEANEQCLRIPKNTKSKNYLKQYESLADQRDVLLAQDVVVFDDSTQDTYVYVAQGEIASTTTDILLSDRATTCHILAIWSQSETCTSRGTLTHIDAAGYDDCIGQAFAEHSKHHGHTSDVSFHVHIIGGFEEEQSHDISDNLLQCLAELSKRYRIVLETCVISSLNHHDSYGGPRLRGLALDCATGRVYPAHCTAPMILGPVRGLRLWSRGDSKRLLNLFPNDETTLIIPKCSWGKVSPRLNQLSDEELLATCSTSPEYEDAEDFCHHLRTTFAFCNQVTPFDVFGKRSYLGFRRLGRTNRWIPVS